MASDTRDSNGVPSVNDNAGSPEGAERDALDREQMEGLKPSAHRHVSLVESYAILVRLFDEVGQAHVAISRSGLGVAGIGIAERVRNVVARVSPTGGDQPVAWAVECKRVGFERTEYLRWTLDECHALAEDDPEASIRALGYLHPPALRSGSRMDESAGQGECSACDGSGEVYAPSGAPDDDGWVTCQVCDGSEKEPTHAEIAELRGRIHADAHEMHMLVTAARRFLGVGPSEHGGDGYTLAERLDRLAPLAPSPSNPGSPEGRVGYVGQVGGQHPEEHQPEGQQDAPDEEELAEREFRAEILGDYIREAEAAVRGAWAEGFREGKRRALRSPEGAPAGTGERS